MELGSVGPFAPKTLEDKSAVEGMQLFCLREDVFLLCTKNELCLLVVKRLGACSCRTAAP